MTDLTSHQRSILQAVLLGMEIEKDHYQGMPPVKLTAQQALIGIVEYPHILRIALGQEDKVVRLYGSSYTFPDGGIEFDATNDRRNKDTHYIDIGPDGIVGGKL